MKAQETTPTQRALLQCRSFLTHDTFFQPHLYSPLTFSHTSIIIPSQFLIAIVWRIFLGRANRFLFIAPTTLTGDHCTGLQRRQYGQRTDCPTAAGPTQPPYYYQSGPSTEFTARANHAPRCLEHANLQPWAVSRESLRDALLRQPGHNKLIRKLCKRPNAINQGGSQGAEHEGACPDATAQQTRRPTA